MRKICAVLLCLTLLLSGCGAAARSEALQEKYAALTEAEMAAEIICHLPAESRQFAVNCTYRAEGDSEITVTAPSELAGLKATVSGEDLTLSYEDLVLPAGTVGAITAANCLPWLLRAAASGYVLEEGRESLGDIPCLRVAFDTTGSDGEKVLCTLWFNEETLAPVYGECTTDGRLVLSVKMISFLAASQPPAQE